MLSKGKNYQFKYTHLNSILEKVRSIPAGITFISAENSERYISYDNLYKTSLKILGYLQDCGILPGDEAVFQIDDNYVFICFFWACMLGNIIPVPVTIGINHEQRLKLFKIWEVLKRPKLFINTDQLTKVEQFAFNTKLIKEFNVIKNNTILTDDAFSFTNPGKIYYSHPEDLAFIQFSSGSTGNPKGICLSHENLTTNINAILTGMKISSKDSSLSWMPLTHDMGLIGFHLSPMAAGIHHYIMPAALFIRRPVFWIDKTNQHRVTVLSSPNFGYKYFLKFFKPEKGEAWDLSCIRLIVNGAEPISIDLCQEFLHTLHPFKLKNNVFFPVYGLAEASLAVTFPLVGEKIISVNVSRDKLNTGNTIELSEDRTQSVCFVDVGFPVLDCDVQIVDKQGKEVPDNVVGLIHIKGKNVTSGYYNSSATGSTINKNGWLNTGDLGFIHKGRLVITGREKEIIFLNGQNYYPQDIERILHGTGRIDSEKIAACGTFDHVKKSDVILLFILYKKPVLDFVHIVLEMRKSLYAKTGLEADYIIPIKKFPRTTSGKIKRFILIKQFHDGQYSEILKQINESIGILDEERLIDLPQNAVEERLAGITREILGIERISISDNIFEIGADSLKGVNILLRIQEEFNKELSINDLFESNTIRKLALVLNRKSKTNFKSIPVADDREYYEVSPAQKRIYVLQNIESGSTVYNIPSVMLIKGRIDYSHFDQVFEKLIKRHEILRTRFQMIEGEPVQVIEESRDFSVEYIDSSGESIENLIKKFIRPFNLNLAPLIRAGLIKLDQDLHLFLFDMHHIVSDGTSARILASEFTQLYQGRELPELTLQYKDYSSWINKELAGPQINKQKQFWLDQFKNGQIPVLDLPFDFTRPVVQSFSGKDFKFSIDPELTKELQNLAFINQATLYMVLLACFYILLSKYTGQKDIIVGTPFSGRNHPQLQQLVGMFISTAVLRNYPEAEKGFIQFLNEIKQSLFQAQENQFYQFEMIIHDLNIQRDMSRNPLFDVMFVFQNMGEINIDIQELEFQPYDFDSGISKFDLSLFAEKTGEHITLKFEYCTALFKEKTIKRMSEHYLNILKKVVKNSELKITDINPLSIKEFNSYIYDYNNTQSYYPYSKTVCRLFEEQVLKNPKKTALECEGRIVSYYELNSRVNQLARLLRHKGVKTDEIVGIICELTIETVTAILAIFKAGGAYLPVDPRYPEDRIRYLLEDSNVKILLTGKSGINYIGFLYSNNNNIIKERIQKKPNLNSPVQELIFIDDENNYYKSKEDLHVDINPEDLAYVIYTSGSTGRPKGVMVKHLGLTNYIWWAKKMYVRSEEDGFPLYSSLSFDLTVTSIFAPLISGNKIVIYPEDQDEYVLYRILRENKVSIIKLTPSHLSLIKDKDNTNSGIKRFIVGGEDLKVSLAAEVNKSFSGNIEIFNEYGPTETVVGCMIHRFNNKKDRRGSVPVGRPADNVQIYVLDEQHKPVPAGRIGEMYISGDGVARGYLNRPGLTEEKFIDNPFIKNRKMYKTGDLARFLDNGLIEYLGRTDHQVKIRGYRIEPGEIEKTILTSEMVFQTVVVDISENNSKKLCAYVVLNDEYTEEDLRLYLQRYLPEYMIPAHFITLESIPLTVNGKVDKTRLPLPGYKCALKNKFTGPSTPGEEVLADTIKSVMHMDSVNMNDNFFYIGGDSIKAIQIQSRLRDRGYKIRVKDVLSNPIIREMALQLEIPDREISHGFCEGDIRQVPVVNWFFSKEFNNENYYNQSVLLQFIQNIDISRIRIILNELIKHHDSLRMNYNEQKKTLFYNDHHQDPDLFIREIDLSGLSEKEQTGLIRTIGMELKSGFDITRSLLINACLFNLGKGRRELLITAHHLVIDGVSWRILIEDFIRLLLQLGQGLKPLPGQKTHSYQFWAHELNSIDKEYILKQKPYWESVLKKPFYFSPDFNLGVDTVSTSCTITKRLDESETSGLIMKANKPYGTVTEDLLITALTSVLGYFTRQEEVLIELEGHGREEINNQLDISRTTGWFTSMYPVLLDVVEGDISAQIISVKESLRAIPDKGVYFGILRYLFKEIDDYTSKHVRFNFLGDLDNGIENSIFVLSDRDTGPDSCPANTLTALIDINAAIKNNRLSLSFTYSLNRFKTVTISDFSNKYMEALRNILNHCKNLDSRELTPSDFNMAGISKEDLDLLVF